MENIDISEIDVETVEEIEVDIEEIVELDVEIEQIGPRGLSAYEVYIQNGGTLSEKEWLSSLKGDKGDTGEKGETGEVTQEKLDERTGLLSNLKTNNKGNLVNSINELFDSDCIYTFEETNTSVFYMINGLYPNNVVGSSLSSSAEKQIQKAINEAYQKGLNHLILIGNFMNKTITSNSEIIAFTNYSGIPLQNKPTMIFFGGQNTMEKNKYVYSLIRVELVWDSNNDATVTKVQAFANVGEFLSKTNTTSYNPTSDYHPTTKKYVDDTVSNAETKIYIGDVKLYNNLNETEKNVYSLAILTELVELNYDDLNIINDIIGHSDETEIDLTFSQTLQILDCIIGGDLYD